MPTQTSPPSPGAERAGEGTRLGRPPCNGMPPRELRRPYVRRAVLDRAAWARSIRGQIPDITHLAVALTLSSYGDSDGTHNHPGGKRLAHDVCRSLRTVRTSLAWLDEHGFITRTDVGNRESPRGCADTYRLSLPAPLAARLGLWSGGAPQWMERPAEVLEGFPFPDRQELTRCNRLHLVSST